MEATVLVSSGIAVDKVVQFRASLVQVAEEKIVHAQSELGLSIAKTIVY